jgi:DNA-binding NtrC family response regulator
LGGIFLADTDRENIKMFSGFLAQKHAADPVVWQNSRRYQKLLDESESAIEFIRVDNCMIPGLELTQAAIARGTGIHIVWMAESDAFAVDAFRCGAEAYLLLPATGDAFRKTISPLIDENKENLISKEKI